MQIWRLIYGVAVDDLKKQYSLEEIKNKFNEQREAGIGEFFTSSVLGSPTGTPATLAIWAEWEDIDELWGRCMKGIILGIHDGFEEYDVDRTLSQQMEDLFNANVKPISKIRWIKKEFQEPIPEVSDLLNKTLK